jgi:hypothetical protein
MKSKMMCLSLATALMFAGCSKDEPASINNVREANSIGFEIGTGKTRATVADITVLQADAAGIGIYAAKGATSAQFINNASYKYDGAKWVWDGPAYNWPTTGTATDYPIHFYAYHPKAGAGGNVAPLTAALTRTYTIEDAPVNQKDFLAANHKNVASRPASSDVTLAFKHILSKVAFKIVTGSPVTVEVQSIAVKHVAKSNTFNFESLGWPAQPAAFSASHSYMTANNPQISSNTFVGKTTAESVTGSSNSLMLMPQNLSGRAWFNPATGQPAAAPTAAQSYIEVVYRIYETGGDDMTGYTDATDHPDYASLGNGVTGALFVKVGYPLPTNWEMGKAYTYTISLGTNDASGGNLVDDTFIDEDGNDTNLPVVHPDTEQPINVPEPIVPDKPIGFIVSVDNWTDVPGTNLK